MAEPNQSLQSSRFELKYLVDDHRAAGIRDYALTYMRPDPNMLKVNGGSPPGYPIHSLYLDSDSMLLYRQTSEGKKNRFKLRIRFYDKNPTHPAFLEVKRRSNDVVIKERTAVKRQAVNRLLRGETLGEQDLYNALSVGKDLAAVKRFCDLVHAVGAQPATYVSYVREAYVSSESEEIRLTFDRSVEASEFDWDRGLDLPRGSQEANLVGVVLELKFTDRFPDWMQDLAWAFDLERCSVPKYLLCIDALGRTPEKSDSSTNPSLDAWDESQVMSILARENLG